MSNAMASTADGDVVDAVNDHIDNIDDNPSFATNDNAASKLAFEQRVQLLEALVGLNDKQRKSEYSSDSLTVRLQHVVDGLYTALENSGTDTFKRFLHQCAQGSIHERSRC